MPPGYRRQADEKVWLRDYEEITKCTGDVTTQTTSDKQTGITFFFKRVSWRSPKKQNLKRKFGLIFLLFLSELASVDRLSQGLNDLHSIS